MESVSDKACVECNTSKTPLWRSGPAGPKSLCNACGIRYRKKRSIVGSDKKKEKEKEASSSCSTTREDDCGVDLRKKLLVELGKEVVLLRRQRSPMKKVRRKKLGEVEQAAFLLMSLSCGV